MVLTQLLRHGELVILRRSVTPNHRLRTKVLRLMSIAPSGVELASCGDADATVLQVFGDLAKL